MKSLSLGTILEKNFCSDLSNYLRVFLGEIRYVDDGIDYIKILQKYISNKNNLLPIYRSSLIDRIYKMKANYFFDLINEDENEYNDESVLNSSSYNTSFGSFSSALTSSFYPYNSHTGSFSSTSLSYGSYNSHFLRNSYNASYSSSYASLGSFRHYTSYMGSYIMYGSYRGSYASIGSYGSYGSYNFYKPYVSDLPYKISDISDDKNNTIIFKRNIGYPKAIDLSNKKYKNKDMIIQSQIEEKDFVTGYGLELI